jgi:hypothetical protein
MWAYGAVLGETAPQGLLTVAPPPPPPPAGVVTRAGAEAAETFPAASKASTV